MSLRTAPIHMNALFPDHIISKAEEVIRRDEVVATLWDFLTRSLNVQGAVRRGWAQTHLLKRMTVKSVIVLLQICTEETVGHPHVQDAERASEEGKLSPPWLEILLTSLFWGR